MRKCRKCKINDAIFVGRCYDCKYGIKLKPEPEPAPEPKPIKLDSLKQTIPDYREGDKEKKFKNQNRIKVRDQLNLIEDKLEI